MHINRGVVISLALLCLVSGTLVGQTFRGAIQGSVADSSGAGVPDAVVKIEHKGTGLNRTQNTGASGDFNFPELGTGVYTVSVSKQGFQAYSQDLEVAVGKVASLAVTLGVAAQAQTVEVQAAVRRVAAVSNDDWMCRWSGGREDGVAPRSGPRQLAVGHSTRIVV